MLPEISKKEERLLCSIRSASSLPAKLKIVLDYIDSHKAKITSDNVEVYQTAYSAARSEYLHGLVCTGQLHAVEAVIDEVPYRYGLQLRARLLSVGNVADKKEWAAFHATYLHELLNPMVPLDEQSFTGKKDFFDYPALLRSLDKASIDDETYIHICRVCKKHIDGLLNACDHSPLEDTAFILDELTSLLRSLPPQNDEFQSEIDRVTKTIGRICLDEHRLAEALEQTPLWLEDFLYSPAFIESLTVHYAPVELSLIILENIPKQLAAVNENFEVNSVPIKIACELLQMDPRVNPLIGIGFDTALLEQETENTPSEDLWTSATKTIDQTTQLLSAHLRFAEAHGILSPYQSDMLRILTRNLEARLSGVIEEITFLHDPSLITVRSSQQLYDLIMGETILLDAVSFLGEETSQETVSRLEVYLKSCRQGFYTYGLQGEDCQELYESSVSGAIGIIKSFCELGDTEVIKPCLKNIAEFVRLLGHQDFFSQILQEKVIYLLPSVFGEEYASEVVADMLRIASRKGFEAQQAALYKVNVLSAYASALSFSANMEQEHYTAAME